MANFKGGFAFNNEAAKVEVEQSPNGALISCINPVTGESMGGGNPNSVQVIAGTLDNPFGDVDISELILALENNGANAVLNADITAIGYTGIVLPLAVAVYGDAGILATYSSDIVFEKLTIAQAYYNYDFEDNFILNKADQVVGDYDNHEFTATDIKSYASLIPTTLTIYWHPMPETEG